MNALIQSALSRAALSRGASLRRDFSRQYPFVAWAQGRSGGMSLRASWLLVVAFVLASPSVSQAQWSSSDREQLVSAVESASEQLEGSRLPRLEETTGRFVSSVDQAKNHIASHSSGENFQQWMRYLELDPILEAIEEAEASDDRRVARKLGREAVALRFRLIGIAPGLERDALKKLRRSTDQLIAAVRFRDEERAIEQLEKQLGAFAVRLKKMDSAPTANNLAEINQMIGLLQSANQVPQLVSQLKAPFGAPNLSIAVSEKLIQSAIHRGVNESRSVRECILGTQFVGDAWLLGVVSADVLPSAGSVRLQVSLSGNVQTNNTGRKGPVKLRTVGNGQVNVSRMIHVSEAGIRSEPVVTQATLNTEVTSIEHQLRIVRKIARRRVAEQKGQANQIALRKLRERVGTQFSEQTDEMTAVEPPDMLARIRPLLGRLDLPEPTRQIGSTDDGVYVEAKLARPDQLSSPWSFSDATVRPPVDTTCDFTVQVHETLVDNLISPVLAGRTMSEKQIDRLLGRIKPDSSDQNQSVDGDDEAEQEPFEIDFARLRPVVFEARDQTVRLGIRGTRFSQGARELKRSIEVTAVYRPALMEDGKALLIRDGEVEVSFPGGRKRLSVTQTGLKRTIQKKFADVFPEQLMDEPLKVPSTVKLEAIAGKSLRPQRIESANGWLTISVNR